MKQRFNWQVWAGFLLSIIALVSYPFVFVRWPLTRDFPWANLLLFGIAVVISLVGIRRAFAPDRRRIAKIGGSLLGALSILVVGFFLFSFFIASRWLPTAQGAPHVGQKAPDFTLADTTGRMVSLSELTSAPINAAAPKGVLLIFYRGYW
jgi:drug/metabolite transporter (DMT)-like permease